MMTSYSPPVSNYDRSDYLEVEVNHLPLISYAMFHNHLPPIGSITVTNITDRTLHDVTVTIGIDDNYSRPWSFQIDRLDPDESTCLKSINLMLNGPVLARQLERQASALSIEARDKNTLFFDSSFSVEVLSYNEWGGVQNLPALLGAFIQPNHPEIEGLLHTAASVLDTWDKSTALDGYQSGDRHRVKDCVAALYYAVRRQSIGYVVPPARFMHEGQKIRSADGIMTNKLATCLDISLLFASALEQMGLNPMVLLFKDHAQPAVWLNPDRHIEAVCNDAIDIRKAVDLQDLVSFEATLALHGNQADFNEATNHARNKLDDPSEFICAINVASARTSGIKPLPSRLSDGTLIATAQDSDLSQQESPLVAPTAPVSHDNDVEEKVHEAPADRFDRWKQQLLDTSRRNRLIDIKTKSKTKNVRLLCGDIGTFEDTIASGVGNGKKASSKHFSIKPRESIADSRLSIRAPGSDTLQKQTLDKDIVSEKLKKNIIVADTTERDLAKRLKLIAREANRNMEEGGAGTLYLAIGFVKWFEDEHSEVANYAPILLYPVDLHRGSAKDSYRLRVSEDDFRVNETFLKKMQQDFGLNTAGLDELPEDDSGLDVIKILQKWRRKIEPCRRWEVIEDVYLSLFSFAKYLMWNDLEKHADKFRQNKLVQTILDKTPFKADYDYLNTQPREIDMQWNPSETFCVMDADASQLKAVWLADKGQTFVLQGPPGTGKSQTITNIIAQALARGKTVLFVSEKMAALNVVYHRLQKAGLGPLCLQLHSKEAKKTAIIEQFRQSQSFAKRRDTSQWEYNSENLRKVKDDLNRYVAALHKKHPSGKSVFGATATLIGLKDTVLIRNDFSRTDEINQKTLDTWWVDIALYKDHASNLGDPVNHSLIAIQRADWRRSLTGEAQQAMAQLEQASNVLENQSHSIRELLPLLPENLSWENLKETDALVDSLLNFPAIPSGLLDVEDWHVLERDVDTLSGMGKRYSALRQNLAENHTDGIFDINLELFEEKFKKWHDRFFLFAWFALFFARMTYRKNLVSGKPGLNTEILENIQSALEVLSLENQIGERDVYGQKQFSVLWDNINTDWDELTGTCRQVRSFQSQVAALSFMPPDTSPRMVCKQIVSAVSSEGGMLQCLPQKRQVLQHFREAFAAYSQSQAGLFQLLDVNDRAVFSGNPQQNFFAKVRYTLSQWKDNLHQLHDVCNFNDATRRLVEHGLGRFIDAIRNNECNWRHLRDVTERSFWEWWLDSKLQANSILEKFTSIGHNRKIECFKQYDLDAMQLARKHIQSNYARAVAGSFDPSAPHSSEMGILNHELKKQKRHKAIRKLLEQTPTLHKKLKPCKLMSPLSVAQYVPPEPDMFDLVIFDEASQIPPWDALGAIGRGKQVIVVGDSKQLPPTNFFQKQEDEDLFSEDDLIDMDSILEEVSGSSVHEHSLLWHYRSRHENLIAFSNYHYYDNSLYTFPSAVDKAEDLGVSFIHVTNGVYDRSKSRTNKIEAKKLVDDIIKRLRDANGEDVSLGIVTFSTAQQGLVEDLLDDARRKFPEIEPYFNGEKEEPVFVKNLENVQGDERDIIVFSICYGPDFNGKLSMNFGPINKKGGERRLNVAVTRARKQLLVYASMTHEQIAVSQAKELGPQHLKTFLHYAEGGPKVFAEEENRHSMGPTESPLEEAVKTALTAKGWQVVPQVGCSNYRIDLAVVDPDMPGRFLLGIECDGAMYHSGQSARERDRLRQEVLEGLGWKIHRIWSTDWWEHADKELEKALDAIEAAQRTLSQTPQAQKVTMEPTANAHIQHLRIHQFRKVCRLRIPVPAWPMVFSTMSMPPYPIRQPMIFIPPQQGKLYRLLK